MEEIAVQNPKPPKPYPAGDPDIKTDKQFFIQTNFDFRRLYKNGAYYIGKVNLYRLWNNLMLWMFKKFTRKIYRNERSENYYNIH